MRKTCRVFPFPISIAFGVRVVQVLLSGAMLMRLNGYNFLAFLGDTISQQTSCSSRLLLLEGCYVTTMERTVMMALKVK